MIRAGHPAMNTLLAAVCCLALLAARADANGFAAPLAHVAAPDRLTLADWQDPALLPPRLRNHCVIERWSGRSYCADHCGRGFQVFYCSPESSGCCAVGHGYCDSRGHLRCHP